MANTLKKKMPPVPPPPDPEVFNEDKEEDVSVMEVVKDERTTKIAGAVSLLFAVFLFVAFTSYMFTWQEDQDKVHQFGIRILASHDVRVYNLLGVLGAYIAHLFIFNGFGISSYFICTFFFVLGVNLLYSKKVFSLVRNLRYVIVGLTVFSTLLAFVTPNTLFSWGGAVGEMTTYWLQKWIGTFGTGAAIFIVLFAYIIWRFNPEFKLPERKTVQQFTDEDNALNPLAEQKDIVKENPFEEEEEVPLFITEKEEKPSVGNRLKGDGSINVIMPDEEPLEQDPLIQFDVNERTFEDDTTLNDLYAANVLPITPNAIPEDIIVPEIKEEHGAVLTIDDSMLKEPADNSPHELEILPSAEDEEEVEEPVIAAKVEKVIMDPYDPSLELSDYKYPTLDLLETHGSEKIVHDPAELENNKNQIIATLKNYDIAIQRIAATVGPTVTLYEIVPAPGIRISKIKNLEDDIALSLAALGIRIIAPIPGRGTIGIEVPNVRKTIVSMKTLLSSEKFINNNFSLPIAIGKKIDNENFIVDLASMPHLLMAGATGQGKSVGINTLLVSLLYKKHPSQLKFVLVDPKKVELSLYKVIEKHFLAKLPGEDDSIITDTKKVVYTLNALCIEMDNRYDLLKEAGCRNIREYNDKFIARRLNPQKGHQYLPFIVLVVDEFADLIMTAGKEIEMPIARLAQLARAVGIHLIIATQRPSVNIITGTIKANFPARVAFKVSSKIDSRTILDHGGAEQLIGKGDMLVSYNGETVRLQCAFVDTPEVEKVCEFIGSQRGYPDAFLLPEYVDEKEFEGKDMGEEDKDPLFVDAARLIVQNQMGSTSLIQRRMKLGYNRAGRLMDQLESAGIVGPNLGSKAREVRFKTDSDLEEYLSTIGLT